jgi:hypothetical protein
MADQAVIGKPGRVTGKIGPGLVGEVMVAVRGGSEAFHAYAEDEATIAVGSRVLVVDYLPPRSVIVVRA